LTPHVSVSGADQRHDGEGGTMAIQAPPREPGVPTGPGKPGRAPIESTPRRGSEALGRELGTAFYRLFPAFLIIVAVGLLVVLALWATSDGAAKSSPGRATQGKAASGQRYRINGNGTGKVVSVTLSAQEITQEIAPDVKYDAWTFDGTVPGPVIRVHVGDTVHFTLRNDSTMGMDHSIDFHAAQTPWDVNYQPIHPGQTASFDWVARFPGVFMYHCGTPPVLMHIANGMYGAIIVLPEAPLPKAREYVLVQSEFYPGDEPVKGVYQGDLDKMLAVNPAYVVFNGMAGRYQTTPLEARPDERIRLWVVDAGPTLFSAFHVIGAMFDHAYPDGNPTNVQNGVSTYTIAPGGGAMFELRIPDAGLYPFVTHAFSYTGRGAVGVLKVTADAPDAPASYPALGDPFTAGVTAEQTAPSNPAPGVQPSQPAAANCVPKGSNELKIAAANLTFDTTCLAAMANMPITLTFDNKDQGVPHNVSIYSDSTAVKPLFQGDTVTGPGSVSYQIDGVAPGTYYFRCDVHPSMNGTFVVAPMGH
jgi:nitrite reductase (NO-forming)